MSPLFFALGFALMALLVYMGRYSGRVRAEASRFIAAPPEACQAAVADLAGWQAWNPWLEHARQVPATVEGPVLRWNAPDVGRGSLRQTGNAPQKLQQRLDFDLPFALRGRSEWRFEPAPGGTQVTWRVKARVAFTLRAFAATVQGATALDLRFGLDALAARLEGTPPAYRLDYLGIQPQAESRFAQALHRGPLDRLADDLPPLIARTREALAQAGQPVAGPAVVHYLKTQLKLRTVDCRVGVELAGEPPLPEGLTLHTQPAHQALVVHVDGPPEALELAWYQAMQRLRVMARQPHPQLPPHARYLGDPAPGRRGVVELVLPLRA